MARRRSSGDTDATVSINGGPEVSLDDFRKATKHITRNTDLERFVNRLVNLETEKKEVSEQIKEVLSEAEGQGFSKKALQQVVKRQMEPAEKRAEREVVQDEVERMMAALGEFTGTPLGAAAMERAGAA